MIDDIKIHYTTKKANFSTSLIFSGIEISFLRNIYSKEPPVR